VSLLDEKGRPCVTERVYVLPPGSQIGPITPQQRQALMASSVVAGVYEKTVDRESAFELLTQRTQVKQADAKKSADAAEESSGGLLGSIGDLLGGGPKRSRAGVGEQLLKSAASSIGREVGRQIIRGVLGSILGSSSSGKRRR
jgi:hypothetical protein